MSFEELRLAEPLVQAVQSEGYISPTPIQSAAIPLILEGRDVLGSAQTGTGKTAAFALPILQRLMAAHDAAPAPVAAHAEQPAAALPGGRGSGRAKSSHARGSDRRPPAGPARSIRALVLAPTRELAQQICESFATYGRFTNVKATVVFGGVNQGPQARALRSGVDVLIATPGRLLDLVQQRLADISRVEVLVLDEADRMLDMGFLPDLRRIVALVPKERQTLLFSATMPVPIRNLAHQILRDPTPVQVARVSSAPPTIEHWVYRVETPDKPALLARLLRELTYSRVLVFVRTKRGADKVAKRLEHDGIPVAALHSNLGQGARTKALADFRSAKTPVLVATDVAARGLDIDDISHVFNYDLHCDAETYIHRTGRTGRAGSRGTAISFCNVEDYWRLQAIERLLQGPMKRAGDTPPPPPVMEAAVTESEPPLLGAARPAHRGWRVPRTSRGRGARRSARPVAW
ncbi:MAG: DEAD/DEAH box helicase [Phycisphaerae bacterium]|nr:DEAD/DEAH box helicase [Phycisphaerae bacterium]MCZ2400907.1 DEAD/DEAH box helicase [Phycisphaerae bacterium]